MTDRAHAERLDAEDPLAAFRERFVIDDPETIYLDGNSLGRLPIATRERLTELTDAVGLRARQADGTTGSTFPSESATSWRAACSAPVPAR